MPVTFDTVRKIGLTFPGVEASTAYGSPALKVNGKIMAGMAINKSAEPGSLMIRVNNDDRDELMTGWPCGKPENCTDWPRGIQSLGDSR